MNFMESITPDLWNRIEILVFVVGALGAVMLIYSMFVEAEHRRDLVRLTGAGALGVYALYIGNLLFTIAMGGVFLAALIEFIEIYLGLHKHSKEDLDRYKKMR